MLEFPTNYFDSPTKFFSDRSVSVKFLNLFANNKFLSSVYKHNLAENNFTFYHY